MKTIQVPYDLNREMRSSCLESARRNRSDIIEHTLVTVIRVILFNGPKLTSSLVGCCRMGECEALGTAPFEPAFMFKLFKLISDS